MQHIYNINSKLGGNDMTYLQEIEEIIKTHPEIPQAVVGDVIYRSRCWIEGYETSENDSYIEQQLQYLKRWI